MSVTYLEVAAQVDPPVSGIVVMAQTLSKLLDFNFKVVKTVDLMGSHDSALMTRTL